MIFQPLVFNSGGWSRHVPFAYDLMSQLEPKIFVELGTHHGESYFAMCKAVADNRLATTCYAVDTWQGDGHAGLYTDEIFQRVQKINSENFGNFSYLVRSTFEAASHQFADYSIDLLHIDGFHTYEAVKGDFDGWINKVSNRGIVLFHDTVVRHEDFGVWKFWEEVSQKYTTFSFTHGNGLGILFKNAELVSRIPICAELLAATTPERQTAIHEKYRIEYDHMDMISTIKALENRNGELQAEVESLRTEYRRLDHQLKGLYNSQSWRLTKPLRSIKRHLSGSSS